MRGNKLIPIVSAALALCTNACSGDIHASSRSDYSGYGGPNGRAGSGAQSPTAGGGAAGAGSSAGAGTSGGGGSSGSGARDAGRVGIHRLNNLEYDNTIRELLGISATPASSFIADEKALGFDNIADALRMTEAQYEQYFSAADALIEQVFVDAALRGRILECTPSSEADTACTERIIASFGARAFRRPLTTEESERLAEVASEARALGESFEGSIAQVCKAMLSSVPFLYRLELDPNPESSEPRALDGYELASRLSYLVWSTMPDQALFDAAASGALTGDAGLSAQLDRMLRDERSEMFIASFAGQWLGMRDLRGHRADDAIFDDWDDALRDAMIEEGLAYFGEFLREDRPLSELFTADVNFVDWRLADLYGIDGVDSEELVRVENTDDARRGFLGLAGFLTLTSFSYRTAPTLRGKWVLENLLCEEIPPPPPNVPKLDDEPDDGADLESLNVRERLALHREDPTCATCHKTLDPIGLGLETFDAIGRYRSEYAGGDMVDATGTLPDGTTFDGLMELTEVLAQDTRALQCASEKLMTYALSRELERDDLDQLEAIRARWQGHPTLRALLEEIVRSDAFRIRSGAAP